MDKMEKGEAVRIVLGAQGEAKLAHAAHQIRLAVAGALIGHALSDSPGIGHVPVEPLAPLMEPPKPKDPIIRLRAPSNRAERRQAERNRPRRRGGYR